METTIPHTPRPIHPVMVSSTYTDLKEHRAALIQALNDHDLHPKVMEYGSAKLRGDVIDASLNMVRASAAYILLISKKYGQTPEDADRNPKKLSITELEFNEALRLQRPTLLFIMGDDHDVKERDIESNQTKKKKLDAFRERAKLASPGGKVHRVYAIFNSLGEFKDKIASSLTQLCRLQTEPEKVKRPEVENRSCVEDGDIHLNRQMIPWRSFNDECKSRFWACGTSLRQIAERSILFDLHRRGVKDIKVLLPSTDEETASLVQLEEYDRLASHKPVDNQIKLAKESYARLKHQLEDLKLEVGNYLRRYTGIMFANITVIDDNVFIAFYDATGIGDDNFTIEFSKLRSADGHDKAVAMFDRLWKRSQSQTRYVPQRIR